jgi:hypothetical protein
LAPARDLIVGTSRSGSGLPHGAIWVLSCRCFILIAYSGSAVWLPLTELAPVLYIQRLMVAEEWTSPSKTRTKTDSRTAKRSRFARRLGGSDANGDSPSHYSRLEHGDLRIMNMVILIGCAQMFCRNFGLRHIGGVISYFALELAGPNAGRKIVSLFARPNEWLRSRPARGLRVSNNMS